MRNFFLLVLPLACMAFCETGWITVNFDERASIDFPAEPEKTGANGVPIWSSYGKDSSFKCIALCISYSNFGLDSARLAKELEGENFYKNFKTSMLGQIQNAKLLTEEVTKVKGRPAYKLTVDMGEKGPFSRMYCTNVFVGEKMYSCSFYENDRKPQEANRNKFFESFKVN